MKRIIAVLLVLPLLMTYALANDDDDLLIEEVIETEESDEENGTDNWYESDGSIVITLTATGDFTIGGDSRKKTNIFEDQLKKEEGDLNFTMRNVRDILLADDLTIVNFEGTLTNSTYVPAKKKNNEFLFSAPPEYVSMLSENGVEAAALENNHTQDHGNEVYQETKQTLRDAGIVYSNSNEMGVIEVKGIQIAMLSYLCIDRYESLWDKVPADIAAAKEKYPIVIVSFHWGNEKDYSPTQNQVKMGRLAVDSGADLVLGHHSHRINPIELYKGVYICYSLGNFCFAGNIRPDDMCSYMFQTKFAIKDGEIRNNGFIIIPIRISSRKDRNDFIPTPADDSATDSILITLKRNGQKMDYAVQDYPLSW